MNAAKIIVACAALLSLHAREIVFPPDKRAILNIKTELGAKGDGIADDTEAIQTAIERCRAESRTIYLPNGTYRVTRTIVFKPPGDGKEGSMVGPWIYGQDRDKTIIKLADRQEGFTDSASPREMIRGVSRPDGARMNADFFDRIVCNLTMDTGDNPGAIGIKYYSNNTGLMKDVVVRGNGACGIDLGFVDQNGPHLIQDVEIAGFAIGMRTSRILNSQTLSRVTIRDAREVGLLHRGQVLSVEQLRVINSPLAVDSGEDGVLSLVDADLSAANSTPGPAILLGEGHLYVARLKTSGFATAIAAPEAPNGSVKEALVDQYSSHPVEKVGKDLPDSGLLLRPENEPVVPYPSKASDWVCANDFGAQYGDNEDDAPAIQKAIDEAARKGATTVYILGSKGRDPNWYLMRENIRVHGSVQRIVGFGFVRIFSGESKDSNYPENLARFVVDDEPNTAPVVIFENLHVFAPSQAFVIEAKSPNRTVVCRSIDGTIVARPGTKVFLSNCVGHLYQERKSKVWVRQWNTENGPAAVGINTRNDGGELWILGMKTEAKSTKIATLNGGRTEVIGVHNYNTSGVKDQTPFFDVRDAALSVAGYREVCFNGNWWNVPVRATVVGDEFKHTRAEWQTRSLLRAGTK